MCGIVGIYYPKQKIPKQSLEAATQALAHRGPDGQGIWMSADQTVGIGHRRLNIVDIAGGAQPIFNEDRTLCASVNGEFYDDQLLRKQLEAKQHKFRTHSDSELILHLYEEYGLRFVDYLRGEFALILYDLANQRMLAVRDRFGIKPLCYHHASNGALHIASEAKALFAAGIVPAWNEYAFYHTLCFQYTPVNQTLFQGIQQLPPGHILIYDGKQLIIQRYWDLDYSNLQTTGELATLSPQLDTQLRNAITCRLRSDDVKMCCHLSGGIDSATIASMASEILGKPLPCFSVSFPHARYDEIHLATALAEKIGADFYPVTVDADNIIEVLADAVYYSEGLAINSHLAAKFLLNRAIKKQGFKIALSGEGADELFMGYPHLKQDYQPQLSQQILEQNTVLAGVQISNDIALPLHHIEQQLGVIPTFIKAKAAIGYKLNQLLQPHSFTSDQIFTNLLHQNDMSQQLFNTAPSYQASYLWIKFALAGYILKTLGDGCEMAHGIEGRVPFLDHHLFEFSKQIPLSLKVNHDGVEKYILRETVKKYVTPAIYQRQKHTFMAPPLSLLNNKKGFEFVNDCIRSTQFKHMPFYDNRKVVTYLDATVNTSMQEQIATEPVIMTLLTSFLLQQRYYL